MIELTEEGRKLLSNLSKDPVLGLVEHHELRNLLARDAANRGKVAVDPLMVQYCLDRRRPCSRCGKVYVPNPETVMAIAEAEAALKEGE